MTSGNRSSTLSFVTKAVSTSVTCVVLISNFLRTMSKLFLTLLFWDVVCRILAEKTSLFNLKCGCNIKRGWEKKVKYCECFLEALCYMNIKSRDVKQLRHIKHWQFLGPLIGKVESMSCCPVPKCPWSRRWSPHCSYCWSVVWKWVWMC